MKGARSFLNDIENGVAERIGNSYIYQGKLNLFLMLRLFFYANS